MSDESKLLSRRSFLEVSTLAAGAVLFSFPLASFDADAAPTPFTPNAWLRVDSDGRFVFILDKTEMGQGVHTALPMLFAEELDMDPAKLAVETAPVDSRYGNPAIAGLQATGGSTSVATSYLPLRRAGAVTRAMFIEAAAKEWKVPAASCTTDDGFVVHAATNRRAAYAQLAPNAALLKVPKDAPLKDPASFRYIGKSRPRLDGLAKVTGTAGFGIDVTLPDLRCAAVVMCPNFGGSLKRFDATKAKAVPGVEDVIQTKRGVAVVAKRYWQAKKAAELVEVEWNPGPHAQMSSATIAADYETRAREAIKKLADSDDARGRLLGDKNIVKAEYHVPYVAHATMEPMNCTAHVTANGCDVWAPTQAPQVARQAASEACGLPLKKINVHTTFLGGGFGRRLYQDFVYDAVEISKAVKKPIKLIWTREDDMRHDYYRPATVHALRASYGDDGKPSAWAQAIVGQSIMATTMPEWLRALLPGWVPSAVKGAGSSITAGLFKAVGQDPTSVEGAKDLPYDTGVTLIDYKFVDPGVPIGFWRSVGHSYTGFVVESFVDELAHAAKQDPVAYRQALLADDPRHLATLKLAAEKAGWSSPPPAGVFRGVAVHESFGSVCAQVAEVTVGSDNAIKVKRIVCAVDCGRVVNPSTVVAQVTSGIVYGLGAALFGSITLKDGAVEQSNFHDYPVPRLTDVPQIDVHIVPSDADPKGIGEPALPPVAAAIGNAVFAATGKRLRKLPLNVADATAT